MDQSTLSLTLSVEVSLIFIKEENQKAYEALLFFSLSPSGYLTQHLIEMFGESWEGIQNLLLSRSLIQKKKYEMTKNQTLEFFICDIELAKIIRYRTNEEELEDAYAKNVKKM